MKTFDEAMTLRVVLGLALTLAAAARAEPAHVRLLELQRQALATLTEQPGDGALCDASTQTAALVREVQRAFADGVPTSLRAQKPRGVGTSTSIPDGLVFWVVDFEGLAKLAPSSKTSRFLLAASPVVAPLAAARPPVWLRQESSLRACTDLTTLNPLLKELARADTEAPDCARALMEQPLTEAFEALGRTRCFCEGTRKPVAASLALLQTLRWKAARRAASSLEKSITTGAATWGCLEDTIDFTR